MRVLSRLGVRARLVGLTVALLGVAGLVAGVFLEAQLRGFWEGRLEAELTRHARSFDVALGDGSSSSDPQALASRLGKALDVRLTLIDGQGHVLADSTVDDPARLEAHDDRPEVIAARRDEVGSARRTSATLGAELFYVATLRKPPAPQGQVVRVARPATLIGAQVRKLRTSLLIGGLIALLVATLVASIAWHLSTQSLRRTVMRARKLNQADIETEAGDELDYLMGSFESMSGELRRALRRLAKARDRFEVVIEGMDQAVFRLSGKQEIKLANRAALEWLELDEAPLGENVHKVFGSADLDELLASEGDAVELQLPTGRRVLAQHSRMRVSRGSILVMQDVTKLRRLEAVRQDFVANVSHELRTPISVIRATTEALLESDVDEERRRHFLGALHRASVRIGRLVGDLLDLARIESGTFQPELVSVRLADLMGACADAVMPRIEEREHEVELDLEEGLHVVADASALEQVLVNLLDNAAKYTPPGGRLIIRARRTTEGQVRIEVADNGPGIAEQHRPRLFERFYRVDPGRSKEMGGTGLGLSIVKHLVLAMHGEVGMQPGEHEGAVFFVELPEGEAAVRAA